ncbi:tetratricopeptide repeat-containing sulfotransferase family protein [Pseudoalteromonas 'SMAR']|uniref:tetratricopeptide repeat-containing sulfotransferase family protein n=1 Tax=Pseudoalteromonas 'SMAR' TaxID=3416908 RepID=UPI003AF30E62
MNSYTQHVQQLLQKQQISQAHQLVVEKLQRNGEDHHSWYLLAEINKTAGDLAKARQILQKAAALAPLPLYLTELAKCYYQLGALDECQQTLEQLQYSDLDDAVMLDTLGNLHTRLGNYPQAHELYTRATALANNNPDILLNGAISHTIMAQPEQAEALLQQALSVAPSHVKAHLMFAEQSPVSVAGDHIEQLQSLLNTPKLATEQQLVYHAMALQYEKLKEYQQAFACFHNSKNAVAGNIHFAADKHQAFCQSLITQAPELNQLAHSEQAPIFVMGMPRSGTTLVDKLLQQSQEVASLGELNDLPLAVKHIAGNQDPAVLSPDIMAAAAKAPLNGLYERYRQRYLSLKGQHARGCDKQPFNFYYIDFILACFPSAKIILMLRGKADCCIANYRQAYQVQSPFHHYAFSLDNIKSFYDDYAMLATHFANKYPAQVKLQHYEQLVSRKAPEVKALYDFCDLPWQENSLEFYNTPHACATASKLQIRQPLNSKSIGYWRNYQAKWHGS